MPNLRFAVVVSLVSSCAAVLVGCGAARPGTTDAGPSPSGDAAARVDPSSSVEAGASVVDATTDADVDADGGADAGVCTGTLAAACANGACAGLETWAAVTAECATPAPAPSGGPWIVIELGTCGDYDVRFELNQLGTTRYYDKTSGALVAVVDNTDTQGTEPGNPVDPSGPCVGGPSGFALPEPCALATRCIGPDAGASDAAPE